MQSKSVLAAVHVCQLCNFYLVVHTGWLRSDIPVPECAMTATQLLKQSVAQLARLPVDNIQPGWPT